MLYLLGAMSLSMALQLDRHGLWNLLGPSLFALGIMAVAWVRAATLHNTHQPHNITARLSRQTEEERKEAGANCSSKFIGT